MTLSISDAKLETTSQETFNSEKSSSSNQKDLVQSTSRDLSRSSIFPKVWSQITDDKNLTLYGFRRFKTSHLLNLRFLEEEISEYDRRIYQARLKLDIDNDRRKADRLGLQYSHRDSDVPDIQDTITVSMVLRMRSLLKEYGSQSLEYTRRYSLTHKKLR